MASPVATVGVEYDGFDCQVSDLSIFLEIVRGLDEPPAVRGDDTIVPSAEGRSEGSRVNDVLRIELFGHVRADPAMTTEQTARESYRANAEFVRTLFATDRARATLVVTLEDGGQKTISARPLNAVWDRRVAANFANVSIELEGYGDWATVGS